MPELSVSLQSSIAGLNDMSFGNVIGSNIFNTFVVIGVSAILTPLVVSKEIKKYDLPILIGIYGLLILFAFVISSGKIVLWESILLFSITIIYTAFLIYRSRQEIKNSKENEEEAPKRTLLLNIILVVIGLTGIILGGDLVVDNAKLIATALKVSEKIIGLTIVAIGTSLPELVTSVTAAIKGDSDIAIGNIVGSNIFNMLFIIGVSAVITPIKYNVLYNFDMIILFVAMTLMLIFPFIKPEDKMSRTNGAILTILYIIYLLVLIFLK
jgi:cation:H+ antiporter